MASKRTITTAFCFAACVLASSVHAGYKESSVHLRSVPEIGSMQVRSRFFGFDSAVKRPLTGGEAAYDYSSHIIKDGGLYRLYSGGRWFRPGVPNGDGDHVLQHVSKTGLGGTWRMPRNRPEFWSGSEEGKSDTWFAGNYIEPEVVKVKGKYYMYTEVEIDPGKPIDAPGENAVTGCDRIQLHISKDGSNWTRWSEKRGVVVDIDDPTHTYLHHQEVVYVPWDKDKKPFWLYMAIDVGAVPLGHWRIRSSDPTTFNWRSREPVEGMAQLGNQIGYAKQAPGGPLFVRITFMPDADERAVPCLQFSRDGLKWFWGDEGPTWLDGSKDNRLNKNCYFLGLSTIDGTGRLEYLGKGKYRAIYAATTCSSPVAPDIFNSEIGVGELVMTIIPKGRSD